MVAVSSITVEPTLATTTPQHQLFVNDFQSPPYLVMEIHF